MQGGWFSYGLLGALAIALLVAAATDIRRREIDNWLNAGIAICAPLFWFASGMSWLDVGFQIAMATMVFIILAALFATGSMGGGDVKLLTVLALWVHPLWFLQLLVVMSVAGGLLTLVLFARHRLQQSGGRLAVPYGVAISFAGLWTLGSRYVWNTPVAAFLG